MTYESVFTAGVTAIIFTFGATNSAPVSTRTGASETATTEVSEDGNGPQAKITDRSHPDYKRCRREPVIGSRARMRDICMTNRQWEEYARAGNSGARSILADASQGGMRQE